MQVILPSPKDTAKLHSIVKHSKTKSYLAIGNKQEKRGTMPFIEWDDRMSMGVQELDEQHKEFLQILNAIHDVCVTACDPHILKKTLEDFLDYTRTHFQAEEAYMVYEVYPDHEAHLEEHMLCSLKAADFYADFLAGTNPQIEKEVLAFLKTWMLSHILKTDRKLGRSLENHEQVQA